MNFSEDIYEALLKDLFSRHPSVQTAGFTPGAYKPGLAGMLGFVPILIHRIHIQTDLIPEWKRF